MGLMFLRHLKFSEQSISQLARFQGLTSISRDVHQESTSPASQSTTLA